MALKKMLECSVCLCVIYKLQREVLEIRRYLTGSGKDVFGAWMLLRLGLSPETAESLAQPRTPNEGPVHSRDSVAGASCIDPSADSAGVDSDRKRTS